MAPSVPSDLADAVASTPASRLLPERVVSAGGDIPDSLVLADAVPLTERTVLAVLRSSGGRYTASLVTHDGDGVRRARPDEGGARALLDLLAEGETHGRFRFERLGDVPGGTGEQPIDTDQSNQSIVVGEQALLKLQVGARPGPHPGRDLPAHLAAVGFQGVPAPLGAVVWHGGVAPTLLATAAEYLPGATDGWSWYLDLLLAYLTGAQKDASLAPAAELGSLTADLHLALASPSPVLPEPVRTAYRAEIDQWRVRARTTVEEAVALTDGSEGERLRARREPILEVLDAMSDVGRTTVTRIHGDLHVGQILASSDGYAITDLDGNPLASPEERTALHPPVRDVASMVRSLDHLARAAQVRLDDDRDDHELSRRIGAWINRARQRFLDAYHDRLAAEGAADLFDPRLMLPFEVEEECREFVYAARHLPRWRYAPDLALQAMFPHPTGADDGP